MENSILWIEKYRPVSLEEVVIDPLIEEHIRVLSLDRDNIHLIITGLPGIGKTSTVRCIARKILGENLDEGYFELNAAEDRGMRSISSIISQFCKKKVNFTCSKIILFDEADNMTTKCQYDINKMIKIYGKRTRFIFTCNDCTKIIEDIQSICRILRFKKLTNEQITKHLEKICQAEKVQYQAAGLDAICYISDGDMRKAINNLQLTACSFQKITKQNVLGICKMPDPEEIRTILSLCQKRKLEKAIDKLYHIINQGYCYSDIITSFIYVLSSDNNPTNLVLIDQISKTKIIFSSGLKSELQLVAMICRIISIQKKS